MMVTNYSQCCDTNSNTEKIFKAAFNTYRKKDPEIFGAFAFKHLSDVTQYYVHPDNQSYKGTTTLAQPIGEAITLFQSIYNYKVNKGQSFAKGDFYCATYETKDKDAAYSGYFVDVTLDPVWQKNGIVPHGVVQYKGVLGWKKNFTIGAYDKNGEWIAGEKNDINSFYQYIVMFLLCLVKEMNTNSEFKQLLLDYCQDPTVERFVRIHEDLYQAHKNETYSIYYFRTYVFEKEEAIVNLSDEFAEIAENKRKREELLANTKIVSFERNVFNRNYLNLIPSLGGEFVMNKNLKPVCNAIVSGDVRALLLHGPAGTGKTMGCKLICQATGIPVMETVNCTENLDEFILGKYIPHDDKIIFQESYVTKAIREGGAVVFEEINFAKPQHLAFLNSLLDDNGFVRLDNGEVVKRNPNFRFFATMNMGYYGTKELNQALYNRFNAIIELDELSDDAISSMLVARVPECKEDVKKILSVYHKIKTRIQADELDYVISPRNLENWARLAKFEGYVQAAEQAIIPIAKCDRSFEKAIKALINLYSW